MFENVRATRAALTAPGTNKGVLTFASNTGFYPGANGWLNLGDGSAPQFCLIVELISTTQIRVRFIPEDPNDPKIRSGVVKTPSFGASDCTAYTNGNNSFFSMPTQVVRVRQPVFEPIPLANM